MSNALQRQVICACVRVCVCLHLCVHTVEMLQDRQTETKQRSCSALCDKLSPLKSHFQGVNLISASEMENDEEKKAKGTEEEEKKGGSHRDGEAGGGGFE